MLAVDDQKLFVGLLKVADGLVSIQRLETELLRCEEQHRSRDGRLRDRSFIKVADGLDLRTRDRPLRRTGPVRRPALVFIFRGLDVPAELMAHGREEAIRPVIFAARTESLEQRGGEDGRR